MKTKENKHWSSRRRPQNVKPSDRTPACHVPQVQLPRNPRWLPALRKTVSETGRSPRLAGPVPAAPSKTSHGSCVQSGQPPCGDSLNYQGHVYVGQVYHVPAETETNGQRRSVCTLPSTRRSRSGGSRALLEGDLIWATAARGHRHQHNHATGTALPVRVRVRPQ